MARIIAAEDAAEHDIADGDTGRERAILICTHAATMIAIGRALTGQMPEDVCKDDFGTYTCGVSKFRRRATGRTADGGVGNGMLEKWEAGMIVPQLDWREGKGVGGGWDCEVDCYCGHLQDGKERGWFVFLFICALHCLQKSDIPVGRGFKDAEIFPQDLLHRR